MSLKLRITIDGSEVTASTGSTILEAADAAGIYIPRLCSHKELCAYGACRICTVLVNGRPQAACTTPAVDGMVVESDVESLHNHRRSLIEMLFSEGNHYCMFCERSGSCELQALGYRFGMIVPRHTYQFPDRDVDASHPDVMIDRNRCVLCARCVRASKQVDGTHAFQFVGRGKNRRIGVNAAAGLAGTRLKVEDKAAAICPVGAIIKKRTAFTEPVGRRLYDKKPIGSDIEAGASA
ncbi:MAG: 2Fe-2S iron-sulfur cluster-binding protein [bacterium]